MWRKARVTEAYEGELGELLAQHASCNHLMRDQPVAETPDLLGKILIKLYGRTDAAAVETYSVLYLEEV